MEDPGRLPYRALMRDAQREAESKAALYPQRHVGDTEHTKSARGVRQAFRRLRNAIRRHG